MMVKKQQICATAIVLMIFFEKKIWMEMKILTKLLIHKK